MSDARADGDEAEVVESEADTEEAKAEEAKAEEAKADGERESKREGKRGRKKAKREEPEEEEETAWERFTANAKTIGGAVLLAIFIRIVLFEAFEIDGPSMQPTLLHGDRVVVAKFSFGLFLPRMNEAVTSWGMPAPADVVIVRSPVDNVDIVKRVIGVPGDMIEYREGVVYKNGEAVPQRELGECGFEEQYEYDPTCAVFEETIAGITYRTSRSRHDVGPNRPPVEVPDGHVYILGDHRDRSNDSRNPMMGPVPVTRIKGKALFIYLSYWEEFRWDRMFDGVQ